MNGGAPPVDRQARGRIGERIAVALLQRCGYRILARNVRSGRGELDIVAEHEETLVFVEVKARWGERYGPPEEALTAAKRRSLREAAVRYLATAGQADRPWRVDVIALVLRGATLLRWDLYQHALEEE